MAAAQKRIYGRRNQSQRDTFAALLHSSPDTRLEDVPVKLHDTQPAVNQVKSDRPATRAKQTSILQPVSGNVARQTKEKSAGKASTTVRKAANRTKTDSTCTDVATSKITDAQRAPSVAIANIKAAEAQPTAYEKISSASLSQPAHDETVYTDHCQSLLSICGQAIQDFSDWSKRLTEHLNVSKIAEASYGEVYRLSMKQTDDAAESHDDSVLKVIALTPPEATLPTTRRERNRAIKKSSMMSKPVDVACEVLLLQRMSTIPGFTDFRELTILQGRPPTAIVKAYKAYNKAQLAADKEVSIFPDPAKKSSYPPDQLWAVIEMKDAGTDLERLIDAGECQDMSSAWDIFWQVALALAKGEEAAHFEHRDLHLGNICIKSKPRTARSRKLHYTDLDITLIDYTISRASIDDGVAFMELAHDEHLFNADSTDEYQYDIYRYMRSALFLDDPLAEYEDAGARSWVQYHPQTNLVWLHYVLYMLLQRAADFSKQEARLKRILYKVSDLLDPELVIKNGLTSTGILIATALNNGWLDEQDIIGTDETLLDDLVDNFAALSA